MATNANHIRRPSTLHIVEPEKPLDRVAKDIEAAGAHHKFGVHDLKEAMAKNGVPFARECRIFEVCNPTQAKRVLEANLEISTALPCRISVYEEGGRTKLATIKPTAMLALSGTSAWRSSHARHTPPIGPLRPPRPDAAPPLNLPPWYGQDFPTSVHPRSERSLTMADHRRASLVVSLLTLAAVGLVQAEELITQRDQRGAVTVAVTLITPKTAAEPVKAKVVLDTHSVALDAIALDQAVTLRTDGGDVAATALEQASGSGHHREAVLVFPPLAQPGRVRIVVKNVGGVPERVFDWDLPAAR